MSALLFPNLDALRLALASGLVPPGVARAPARAGKDVQGRVWLEPTEPLARDVITSLGRLGIQTLGSSGAPTEPVASWAEVLPLRRTGAITATVGEVLFEVPDRLLARFVARLRAGRDAPVGTLLLPEPHAGRAWVTAVAPAHGALLWASDPDAPIRSYTEAAPGVWVARGWEHPTPALLVGPENGALLFDPDHRPTKFEFPVPRPRADEFQLARANPTANPIAVVARVEISFRLVPSGAPRAEALWVLGPDRADEFARFCASAPGDTLRGFVVAEVGAAADRRLLLRRVGPSTDTGLPVAAHGYYPDPRVTDLFLPSGRTLRPVLRPAELARVFGVAPGRIVWLEPDGHGIAVHAAGVEAFRPLAERVDYSAAPARALDPVRPAGDPFAFGLFMIRPDPVDERPAAPALPHPSPDVPAPPGIAGREPRWVTKSVSRFLRWLRARAPEPQPDRAGSEPFAEELPDEPDAGRVRPREDDTRGARNLSPDALLHGHDRAARRQDLETRLLRDFSGLDPDARGARWAELAGVYAASGQWLDAGVCWANAIWERPVPPRAWLEQWASAECRAANRAERSTDLERWLGEPARPGTGRVVAALAALFASRPVPPTEFVAALPRVLAVLEQQFDDIPARAAWIARLAVARVTDGDALGLARWCDRLVRRLHDRGPALDLDEPSFLRFRDPATAKRFDVARDWLDRVLEPVRAWTVRHGGSGRLQVFGLDAETVATPEYAQLLLAWGLGALGERTRAREWAARARKALGRAAGPGADPAAHALLGDLFLHRVREAHEGTAPKPGLPPELRERLDNLPRLARNLVDRLREHCRVLEPLARVRAAPEQYAPFWGTDQLGDRLSVLGAAADVNEEARALLALATTDPTSATVPRVVFALLEAGAYLDPAVLDRVLDLVPPALEWVEPWLRRAGWRDDERAASAARYQATMIDAAFAVVPRAAPAEELLRHVTRGAQSGALLGAVLGAAPRAFRAARKFGLVGEAEALSRALDPTRGHWPGEALTRARVGLAAGWLVAGDEEAGLRILNAARDVLLLGAPTDKPNRAALARAYAEALGYASAPVALGRLGELFQRLDPATLDHAPNRYYSLRPLQLIDTVVRSVVTDEFTLGPAVRAWLDEDEFLIRRRVHRDVAALLRAGDPP